MLRKLLLLVTPALIAAGCDGREAPPPAEPDLEGAALVVGRTAAEWGLLAVPRGGGPATFRSLMAPGSVAWTGDVELPASRDAHVVGDALVVLRTPGGEVLRYDPVTSVLDRLAEVDTAAAWAAEGGAGVYADTVADRALRVSRGGAASWELPAELLWAVPVEGGVVALVEHDGTRELWRLREDEPGPAEKVEVRAGLPGIVTAWGRRLALVAGDDEEPGIRFFATVPPTPSGSAGLPGRVSALTASPSSHEIYAAVADPPAVHAVNRFTERTRQLARLDGPVTELRPSLFGEALLARSGQGGALRLPVDGSEPGRKLAGTWRDDLPLALPGGRTLVLRNGAVEWAAGGAEAGAAPGEGGEDSWWLPVRWSPVTERVVADRLAGEPVVDTAAAEVSAAGEDATAGAARPAAPGPDGADRADGPAPGFYAIVGSARAPEGIRALVQELGAAGFPVSMQAISDDAGLVWHRGLVGPYETRSGAEAAARQLRRERNLQTWVTQLDAEGGAEGVSGP